jgi:hypothetical protein
MLLVSSHPNHPLLLYPLFLLMFLLESLKGKELNLQFIQIYLKYQVFSILYHLFISHWKGKWMRFRLSDSLEQMLNLFYVKLGNLWKLLFQVLRKAQSLDNIPSIHHVILSMFYLFKNSNLLINNLKYYQLIRNQLQNFY